MSYLFKYYSKQYDGFMKYFNLDNNDVIIKALGEIAGLKILDIGGGTGTLAARFINLGAEVTILDPEVKMTEVAKGKNKDIKVINGYSNKIHLDDNSIDLIVIRDTFHHIKAKEATLKECKRVLRDSGKIVIYEFDKAHITTKLIALFERSCFEWVKMLTKAEMKKMAESYFKEDEIISVSSYEYIYIGIKE